VKFIDNSVLITGASNGIGKSLAKAYADEGATVLMIDNDKGNGENLVVDGGMTKKMIYEH